VTRARGLAARLALALPLAFAPAACRDHAGDATEYPGAGGSGGGGDAAADVAFVGTATSGKIPIGPMLDAAPAPNLPLGPDALPACCPTVLRLLDPTGNEAWARLKGDLSPLKGDGVVATWANGAWSATVCLQAGLVTKYHFEFPPAAVDAGVDAGAAEEQGTWRVNADEPTALDDDTNDVNLAVVSLTCDLGVDAGAPASDASAD
jgi:hypothetical protein